MCLINVAHEHLITQAGKKSKPALINFMGPGAEGRHMGPRAEKNKYPNIYVKKNTPFVYLRHNSLKIHLTSLRVK